MLQDAAPIPVQVDGGKLGSLVFERVFANNRFIRQFCGDALKMKDYLAIGDLGNVGMYLNHEIS
jgi:hypothetical protein